MNRAPKDTYCFDATKILSADSWLNSIDKRFFSINRIIDPGAESDFRHIVDLLTNDELVKFKPLPNDHRRIGILESTATEVNSRNPLGAVPDKIAKKNKKTSITFDGSPLVRTFEDLLKDKYITRKIIRWTEFQLSEKDLQILFWATNNNEELKEALSCYFDITKHKNSLFQHGLSAIDYGTATQLQDLSSWNIQDFYLAYSFWAFIKGVRYARSLSVSNTYAVHWLRESAVFNSDLFGLEKKPEKNIRIPWGVLIQKYLFNFRAKINFEEIYPSLMKLRQYTLDELPNIKHLDYSGKSKKKRESFLKQGLYQFSLTTCSKRYTPNALMSLSKFSGEVAGIALGDLGKIIKYSLVGLTNKIPEARDKREIDIMVADNASHVLISSFINEGIKS